MSTINEAAILRFYLDTQEYSDRLTAIETQAASTLATQKSEVAAAIAQVNLTQSQTITALTIEVSNLNNLTDSITATQTELINLADQLAQDVTDITVQLTQDKATFTQEIQDALDFLKDDASVASALRTPRKIQGVAFDGTGDINLDVYSKSEVDTAIANATPTTRNATEVMTGVAKIATTAIAQAGTNDTDILTAKKLRVALNASGEAPISTIRGYVIGSVVNAPTILRSMNVISVIKLTSSQLAIDFIEPMTDTNYIVLAYAKRAAAPNEQIGGVTTTKRVDGCTINFRIPGAQADNALEYTVVIL